MKNRWSAFGAVVLAIGLLVWNAHTHTDGAARAAATAADKSDRPVAVSVASVTSRDTPVYLEGLGTVSPFYTVTVKSQVDGRIMRVLFQEGQEVHRGDLLVQIDARAIQIQLHQTQAALARDTAQLKNARLTLERNNTLRAKNLVPQQTVDDQQALVDQLEGTVLADQAQIDNAGLQLSYANITAPIDGRTGLRLVDPGNIVRASDATGIVVLAQMDPIAVLFALPEDDLPQVNGQMAHEKLQVEALDRDGKAVLGIGELQLIDNQIDQSTGTMKLKAVFANPQRALWPNQFVKVRLRLQTLKDALVVPASVVQRGPQGTFAYVVDGNHVAQPRPIASRPSVGESVVVTSGLHVGEQVVTDGQYLLHPGSRVSPR